MEAVLTAADPARALADAWPELQGPVHLVAAGKASLAMASEAVERVDDRLVSGAAAVNPALLETATRPIDLYPAAHPLPDERNIEAAQAIARVARGADVGQTLLVLLSGGGSAHLALPAGDLTLGHLRDLTQRLNRAGAAIDELNAVRKHCEVLKGGGLALMAYPAQVHTLILSDVIGDRLDVIASGPTAPDPTTYQDALDVLVRYDLTDELPDVAAHLRRHRDDEHPDLKTSDSMIFERVEHTIITNNDAAVDAAIAALREYGYQVQGVERGVTGEAREVGRRLGHIGRELAPGQCYVIGGETTVTVQGDGVGGRCQEMALAAALAIAGEADLTVMTFATDGIDGPTDAAGAVVTGETVPETPRDAQAHLAANDSHTYLGAAGALLHTGPTGTNINNIAVVMKG